MVDISNGRNLPIFPTKNVFKSLFFFLSSPPDSISRKKLRGELTFYWGVSSRRNKSHLCRLWWDQGRLHYHDYCCHRSLIPQTAAVEKKGFPVCLEYLNRLFFHRNHLLLRRLAVPPSLVLFYPTPCRHRSLNQRPIFSNFRKIGRARELPSCATTKINHHFSFFSKNIGHTNLLFPSLLFPSSNYLIALQSK